ncbi:MAG: TrkH family potassium uptake protein [Clostridiales bacterium]|nr:TrkH family potassium uptake protein [Clostridiales bacterium]
MNKKLILRVLSTILLVESAAMALALLVSVYYQDAGIVPLIQSIIVLLAVGAPLYFFSRGYEHNFRAKEGFLVVALSWLTLAGFGALPFVLSGMIPNYVDAFFEAVSGFTTTGATVLTVFEGQPKGIMFWRSFTHWIGGMGVLVLTLALLPHMSGRNSHLVRAESPGPTLSKLVPKMGDSAKILYLIYTVMTVVELIALMAAGMNLYDAAIHAFGTAGTGGFSNYGASIAAFDSVAVEVIITIFMILFGVNFVLYYKMFTGGWKDIFKNEELRWYLSIIVCVIILITLMILPQYGNVGTALRYSSFQVASIISTTGYVTADFNVWPIAARMLILVVMFMGSCAGSTAGGMKICRIGMLTKQGVREVRHAFQPRKVQVIRFEGKAVEEGILHQVCVFAFVYVALMLVGGFLVSLEGLYDVETNLTAALTCISNVGPGLGKVGAVENFAGYGPFAKLVLSCLMLAGRLEIFPILAVFHPSIWRRG